MTADNTKGGQDDQRDRLGDLIANPDAAAAVEVVEMMSVVVMRVGDRWFAVEAGAVEEVVVKDTITRIPLTPTHVLGLAMIHSRLVPVTSLSGFFPDIDSELSGDTLPRLVVMSAPPLEMAVVTDEARGVVDVPKPDASREAIAADHLPFVVGETYWGKELLVVLEVPRLIERGLGIELEDA